MNESDNKVCTISVQTTHDTLEKIRDYRNKHFSEIREDAQLDDDLIYCEVSVLATIED